MKVSNPLTIIAIFSGLAETLATVALLNLPTDMQKIFIYFVMAFPAGIVLLFFYILYNRNTVLYAPSDYEDQKHYLEVNNIKEQANKELDSFFLEINKNGVRLSEQEIERAKNNVEVAIERNFPSLQRDAILGYLKNGEADLDEIANRFSIGKSTASHHLKVLKMLGRVVKKESEGSPSKWALNI